MSTIVQGRSGRWAAFLLLLAIAGGNAFAQSSYGRITGRITDPSDALVAGAEITITHAETNASVKTTSNSAGIFELLNVLPGEYRMAVEMQGFKKHERGPISVSVGDVLTVDVKLEVGPALSVVTVTADAPLIEATSASMGQVIQQRQISDLPLPGGAATYLMQFSPGVSSLSAPTHGWLPQARDSISNMSAGGTRARNSEFQLDGAPNVAQAGNIAFSPPPEMIQEFRVQTAAFDASVGRFTGAYVNMAPKTGTNEFHGTGWFSHLSRPLMTHPFFINQQLYDLRTGPPTAEKRSSLWPATRTNRTRTSFTGPVWLPKIYKGRNRTFFSYGNDFMDRLYTGQGFETVPTEEQRRGDLSGLLRLGAQYQVYDPATIAPAPNGRFSRQPLPGNVIPASRLNPTAQILLKYYPMPNAAGTADFRNNYQTLSSNKIDYGSHLGRIDHLVSDRWRFYVSGSQFKVVTDQGRAYRNEARGSFPMNSYAGLVLDNVITVSPSVVVNLRGAVTRIYNTGDPASIGFDLNTLGWPSSLTRQLDSRITTLPTINIEGYGVLNNASPTYTGLVYPTFSGSVMWVRGEHTMRFGGEFRALRENNYAFGAYTPAISFSTNWTRGPLDSSAASPIGQGLASFLLGLPTGGYIDRNTSYAQQSTYQGWYFHDDWKISRTVTLNIGLRHEYEGPTTERYNRSNRGFDMITPNPVEEQARAAYARSPIPELAPADFRTPGGLLFAGVGGQPRTLWEANKMNWAPRIGVAWLVRPRLSVRAGYGIFYESLGTDRNDVGQQGFDARTNLAPSEDNGQTFIATLSDPFPSGFLEPIGAAAGLRTFLGQTPSFFTPTRRHGYVQRWSFVVQRELGGRILVEAGYSGNRGTALGAGFDYDPVPARYLSRSPERDQATINFLTANVPNPFRGMADFAGSAWRQSATIQRSQLLTPFPHFNGVSTTLSNGFSWYHAGHLRMERRFARGFFLGATYTWSKYMEAVERLNPQDAQLHHVISAQDRPHHIVANGQYELPFGPGKPWLSSARAFGLLVGGWSVQAMYTWQSGPPIAFGNVLYRGRLQDIVIPYAERRVERWFNTEGFERSSARQLGSNLRTFPLRLTGLRADGFNSWDISLAKTIRISERISLQLRAESQDALNHAMFGAPNTAPTNTAFGTVNTTIWSEQKKTTVAAKLIW